MMKNRTETSEGETTTRLTLLCSNNSTGESVCKANKIRYDIGYGEEKDSVN